MDPGSAPVKSPGRYSGTRSGNSLATRPTPRQKSRGASTAALPKIFLTIDRGEEKKRMRNSSIVLRAIARAPGGKHSLQQEPIRPPRRWATQGGGSDHYLMRFDPLHLENARFTEAMLTEASPVKATTDTSNVNRGCTAGRAPIRGRSSSGHTITCWCPS